MAPSHGASWPDVVENLMQAVHGARVRGLTPAECEVCAVTKAHRIISRRPTTRLTTLYKRVPFNEGIDIEPAPPYTKEHNGATERSWGVISIRAHALRIGSKLPTNLWPEMVKYAACLLYRHTGRCPRQKH
jgi:hypothetical protein